MKAKFTRIAEELQARIEAGVYGDRLPSEPDLAESFGTTTMTVRKALDILLRREIIRKIPYVGTFVNREDRRRLRIAWGRGPFSQEQNSLIQEKLRRQFLDFDIEFVEPTENSSLSPSDFDLVRATATSRLSYSDGAMPFPLETVAKFRHGDYYENAFDIHRMNNYYYALPILFSPSLLCIDRRLLAGFDREPEAGEIDLDFMLKLGREAKKQGRKLWTVNSARSFLRCLVFAGGGPYTRLADIDATLVGRCLEKIRPLLAEELLLASPRMQDAAVYSLWRQGIDAFGFDPARYFLCAYPLIAPRVRMMNLAAGEFIMLSSHSKYREEGIAVAEYLLSPEVQRLIGEYRTGLPILKTAALDSLDSHRYRDDLFFSEAKHLMCNNALEQEFLLRFGSLASSLLAGEMTMAQFTGHFEYEMHMARGKDAVLDRNLFNPNLIENAGL